MINRLCDCVSTLFPSYHHVGVVNEDHCNPSASVRVYAVRGVIADGNTAPLKKAWPRVKLKAPSVCNILHKLSTRPKYRASVNKLINTSCYVTITDEKLGEFCKCQGSFEAMRFRMNSTVLATYMSKRHPLDPLCLL